MTTGRDIALALRAAYLALHRLSDLQFAPLGVTADQFVLLATLARGHALTQRELALRMTSDPSTVRAMLVLLEKRRLVKRDNHPTDSRARTVALTAKGLNVYRRLWESGEPIRAIMMNSLGPGEAVSLVQSLIRIAKGMNPACVPAIDSTLSPPYVDGTYEPSNDLARGTRRHGVPGDTGSRTAGRRTDERECLEVSRATARVRHPTRRNRTRPIGNGRI